MHRGSISSIALELCYQMLQALVHTAAPIAGMIVRFEYRFVRQAGEMLILGSHLLTGSLSQPALINHSGYVLCDGVGEITSSATKSPSAISQPCVARRADQHL